MSQNVRPKNSANLLSCEDTSCQETIRLLNNTIKKKGDNDNLTWIPLSRGKAEYQLEAWLKTIEQLIWHPEQSSSSILRADIISDNQSEPVQESLGDLYLRKNIDRILLPRRPNLDGSLKQRCFVYTDEIQTKEGLAILMPLLIHDKPEEIPFYHPKVLSLAFHFCLNSTENADATVTVYFLPFNEDKSFNAIVQPQDRLSRTSLALVELQSRIAWGMENGYKKRVEHDTIIPKKEYQELYMDLRDRYASQIIETWCESTDPKKHVFEDLGIAAFILLLWKKMFSQQDRAKGPPCFVDIGCGNGLLVYLLTSEGFKGYGIDVQERKSWNHYRTLDKEVDLRVEAIDPPSICLGSKSAKQFPDGSFLIGNHADELTSWLPFLAQSTQNCSGFINIPCCRYDLDGTISSRSKYSVPSTEVESLVGLTLLDETLKQIDRGPFAESNSTSRNIAYLRYISHLHLQAGWQLEKEALRIPSTKNWALIGRRRIWQDFDDDDGKREEIQNLVLEHVQSLALKASEAHWHARISPTKAQSNH